MSDNENPPISKEVDMKSEDEASWSEGVNSTTKTSDTDSKDGDKKESDVINDGVEILQEVFGKASVSEDSKEDDSK